MVMGKETYRSNSGEVLPGLRSALESLVRLGVPFQIIGESCASTPSLKVTVWWGEEMLRDGPEGDGIPEELGSLSSIRDCMDRHPAGGSSESRS